MKEEYKSLHESLSKLLVQQAELEIMISGAIEVFTNRSSDLQQSEKEALLKRAEQMKSDAGDLRSEAKRLECVLDNLA